MLQLLRVAIQDAEENEYINSMPSNECNKENGFHPTQLRIVLTDKAFPPLPQIFFFFREREVFRVAPVV